MTLTFNQSNYTSLLAEIAPKVIDSEAEYDRALVIAEKLTFNKNKTPEERAIYQLLVLLIEAYEAEHYAFPSSKPYEILQHIMESSGTSRSDLVGKLGSIEVVSEIIKGNRAITPVQANVLGNMFKVSSNLFL
jgi:HTH-type transcriptional regulator / antitoxin HigA